MIQTVLVPTPNGPTIAAVATPSGAGPHPAIIIIHEWWGINDDIHRIAERFAGEGFLALAIDLFEGKSTADAGEAMQLITQLKTDQAVVTMKATVEFLQRDPRCNGSIAVTGFCFGGAMTLAAVCNIEGIRAAVPFYGLPMPKYLNFSGVRTPILGHYAQVDPFVAPDKVSAAVSQAQAAGVSFTCHFYAGGHAFMRKQDPHAYHEESAHLAWDRTLAFLKQHTQA